MLPPTDNDISLPKRVMVIILSKLDLETFFYAREVSKKSKTIIDCNAETFWKFQNRVKY